MFQCSKISFGLGGEHMSAGKYFSSRAQFHHKLSNNQWDWSPKKEMKPHIFFLSIELIWGSVITPQPQFPNALLFGWHRSEHVICNFGKNNKLQFRFNIHCTILRAVATPVPTSKSIHPSIHPEDKNFHFCFGRIIIIRKQNKLSWTMAALDKEREFHASRWFANKFVRHLLKLTLAKDWRWRFNIQSLVVSQPGFKRCSIQYSMVFIKMKNSFFCKLAFEIPLSLLYWEPNYQFAEFYLTDWPLASY